jgi:hypothetical protein
VTIYLSDQDPDGDYYSRIERIEDSFGSDGFAVGSGPPPFRLGYGNRGLYWLIAVRIALTREVLPFPVTYPRA